MGELAEGNGAVFSNMNGSYANLCVLMLSNIQKKSTLI